MFVASLTYGDPDYAYSWGAAALEQAQRMTMSLIQAAVQKFAAVEAQAV
jgi:hypothetical protein